MTAAQNRPPEPCPQCGLLMGHEIAVLVGQHITCPPITPEHARKAQAVETLLTFVGRPVARVAVRAQGELELIGLDETER